MGKRKKFEDNQPGTDQKRNHPDEPFEKTKESARTGDQGRAAFHPSSTTQGGSNFGQGSHALGGESYRQGEEKNKGANYQDEAGRLSHSEDIRQEKSDSSEDGHEKTLENQKLKSGEKDDPSDSTMTSNMRDRGTAGSDFDLQEGLVL